MNFEFTDREKRWQKSLREFCLRNLKPEVIREFEEKKEVPFELLSKAAKLGILGASIPRQYGGSGLGAKEGCLAIMELAKFWSGFSLIALANLTLSGFPILRLGNESQKTKYLPGICKGEKFGALAITEPEAGSDAANIKTIAVKTENGWKVSGRKRFITNGSFADVIVFDAVTDPELKAKKKSAGMSLLIFEKGMPGFTVEKLEEKMGLLSSPTAELVFEGILIPPENILGNEGDGFKNKMKVLDESRVYIASQAAGVAEGAFNLASRYAQERIIFDKKLIEFEFTKYKLAKLFAQIEASKLLIWRAIDLKERGLEFGVAASMAKLYASKIGVIASDEAFQIHGGYGYMKEYMVERYYRDAKVVEVYEGASEVQRLVIIRYLIDKGLNRREEESEFLTLLEKASSQEDLLSLRQLYIEAQTALFKEDVWKIGLDPEQKYKLTSENQIVPFSLAWLATEFEAGKLLLWKTLSSGDNLTKDLCYIFLSDLCRDLLGLDCWIKIAENYKKSVRNVVENIVSNSNVN